MFRLGRLLGLTAALTAGSVGLAAAAPSRTGAAKVDRNRSAQARQAFEDGKKAYTAGDFDKAIELFRQAYEYRDDPSLLFNIGQAYRQKGDTQKAIFFYRAYVRERPRAKNRAEVEARIAELSRLPPAPPPVVETAPVVRPPVQAPPVLPPPPAPEPLPELGPPPFASPREDEPPVSRPGRSFIVGGLVTGGVGAAALATGIVFAVKARSIQGEVESYHQSRMQWGPDQVALEDEGSRDNVIGIAGMAVGAAALLTGATLVWLGARKNDDAARAARISVEVAPHALVRARIVF